jgi:hypothetical protein
VDLSSHVPEFVRTFSRKLLSPLAQLTNCLIYLVQFELDLESVLFVFLRPWLWMSRYSKMNFPHLKISGLYPLKVHPVLLLLTCRWKETE